MSFDSQEVYMSVVEGEDKPIEEKFLHRLFEEGINNFKSANRIALLYKGQISTNLHFSCLMSIC